MFPGILKIVLQSIRFYRRQILYQILIIALLSAIITGSLLTGGSVRTSLKKTATERLGNTGILISSGMRYFDAELAKRLRDSAGIVCTGIVEINGYSQNLNSQKGAFDTHIYAVNEDFFTFQGEDTFRIKEGEVAINTRLADYLGVRQGDELIIKFKEISDIPADAPFAPETGEGKSVVMRIGSVLSTLRNQNFSLSISQIVPMNIFMNLADMEKDKPGVLKINRLLINREVKGSLTEITNTFKHTLKPSDIGLRLRKSEKTGDYELISDRIFIDEPVLKSIHSEISSAAPLITYLGNSFRTRERSTPYSFITGLPSSLYSATPQGDSIIIGQWMAKDLSVVKGDTLQVSYYKPDSLNKLIESTHSFVVSRVVEQEGIFSDSLLMPDFPGISRSESCSDWNAGVPIRMNEIRSKDEEYWKRYRGTPKAFISYEKGKELWGNNYGPATAVRFPSSLTLPEIENKLRGYLDPAQTGFVISNLSSDATKAASESIDFGTLFLSLGFFLIFAAVVLLSFAVSSYFDSKKGQINTLLALGFKDSWIGRYLFIESAIIGFLGCLAGAATGYPVNLIITRALNSVWKGAVQTDTLNAFFSSGPILTGSAVSVFIILVLMLIKIRRFLVGFHREHKQLRTSPSGKKNLIILLLFVAITTSVCIYTVFSADHTVAISFASGTALFITFILFWRQYYIGIKGWNTAKGKYRINLSHLYYARNPSQAVTPILFIAAGIFAVFITGANRIDVNEKKLKRSDGTGGYLLWYETTIPVKEDLNTASGRYKLGFDSDSLSKMRFVQIKRSTGNDASCLNLNHITSPPLLGLDPADFINGGSFSFARTIKNKNKNNPWEFLTLPDTLNTIYGIADQTVLDWGLKLNPGDTLILRAENGMPLNIIIAAGLQSSVFQGYVLIGKENFSKYYPSVSGSSVCLVEGESALTDLYRNTINERLGNYGINIEKSSERLKGFNVVTNTYLSVFGVFGALGMLTGIAGLGFVLLRNYNQRKREYALMLATGFSFKKIRKIVFSDQILILLAGISSGAISALVATLPSLRGSDNIPWLYLGVMILGIAGTGLITLMLSVRAISVESLVSSLKKE